MTTWKVRERAINEHVVKALDDELYEARVRAGKAASNAGFSQQQMSKWLGAKAGNDLPVLTAARLTAICEANGLDASKVFVRAIGSARAAGLFDVEPIVARDIDHLATVYELPTPMSDSAGNVHLLAAQRSVQEEMDAQDRD